VAIDALEASLGLVLLFGLILAIPAVILAGPVFGSFISKRPHVATPTAMVGAAVGGRETGTTGSGTADGGDRDLLDIGDRARPAEGARRQPGFGTTVATVLLPVVLMALGAIGELTLDEGTTLRSVSDILGTPVIALLIGVLVAMFTLGAAIGSGRQKISDTVGGSLPAIAGILLIVAAGGGFKQLLVDSGISGLFADAAEGADFSPLVLGWLVAVGIRLATGSATVATITAAGIVAPLATDLDRPTTALLALAVGAGSLFFSHVNDAGFWLVKEYFGMTVGETGKSWSVMETIISVVGLLGALLLSVVV
jgi:gluconate:H+ symporter, GntP family